MTQTITESNLSALPPLPPSRLLAIARGLGRDAATWRALAQHDPDERWYPAAVEQRALRHLADRLARASRRRPPRPRRLGRRVHRGRRRAVGDVGTDRRCIAAAGDATRRRKRPVVRRRARALGRQPQRRGRDQRARVLAAAADDGLLRERLRPLVLAAAHRSRRRPRTGLGELRGDQRRSTGHGAFPRAWDLRCCECHRRSAPPGAGALRSGHTDRSRRRGGAGRAVGRHASGRAA